MSKYNVYKAAIEDVAPIEGRDRIQSARVLGSWVVVGKDVGVGSVGIYFPVDGIIHPEYLKKNNLYRNSELNADKQQKGFFEDDGRVKAIKLGKAKSDGYFASLDSVNGLIDISKLEVGDAIPDGGDFVLAEKYYRDIPVIQGSGGKKHRGNSLFVEHIDTEQFEYNLRKIKVGDWVVITHKMHGTSARIGNLPIELPKNATLLEVIKEKILRIFGKNYKTYIGSRRVQIASNTDGFHGSNQYRFDVAKGLGYIPKDHIIFGEIVGYVNGAPIMANHDTSLLGAEYVAKYGKTVDYSYGLNKDEFKFYVYRIARYVNDGRLVDYTWAEVKEMCNFYGWTHVKELDAFFVEDDGAFLRERVEALSENKDNLSEDYINPKGINEGVVVSVENGSNIQQRFKRKSFAFKVLEGIVKEATLEDAG